MADLFLFVWIDETVSEGGFAHTSLTSNLVELIFESVVTVFVCDTVADLERFNPKDVSLGHVIPSVWANYMVFCQVNFK